MRRLFRCQLSVLLLLAGTVAAAQIPNSSQNGQPADVAPGGSTTSPGAGEAPATATAIKPGVTITGKKPHAERPLPKLPPDEFTDCVRDEIGYQAEAPDLISLAMCEAQLEGEKHAVLESCLDRSGKTPLPRVIQACTESLDHHILERPYSYYTLAGRAAAYFASGDGRRALDDYNAAIEVAPHNADLYYDRGAVFAAQSDDDAALRDFDTALGIDAKLVPALLERAKIHEARGNLRGALADYAAAIRLQPNTASLWTERGYLGIRQHDYEDATKDEAEAIRLDPKLARAYFLRGAAFADLGDSAAAVSDIKTAVGLDAALARYVTIKGRAVSLGLPP